MAATAYFLLQLCHHDDAVKSYHFLENADSLEGYPHVSSILGYLARSLRSKLRILDSSHWITFVHEECSKCRYQRGEITIFTFYLCKHHVNHFAMLFTESCCSSISLSGQINHFKTFNLYFRTASCQRCRTWPCMSWVSSSAGSLSSSSTGTSSDSSPREGYSTVSVNVTLILFHCLC